jgi:hypothetical protein
MEVFVMARFKVTFYLGSMILESYEGESVDYIHAINVSTQMFLSYNEAVKSHYNLAELTYSICRMENGIDNPQVKINSYSSMTIGRKLHKYYDPIALSYEGIDNYPSHYVRQPHHVKTDWKTQSVLDCGARIEEQLAQVRVK